MTQNYYSWITENRSALVLKKDLIFFKKLSASESIDWIQNMYQTNWYKQSETIYFSDIKKIVFSSKCMHIYLHQQKKLTVSINETEMIESIKKALVTLGPVYRNNLSCKESKQKNIPLKNYSLLMIPFIALSVHWILGILAFGLLLILNTIQLYQQSNQPLRYLESFEYDIQI